MDENSKNGFSVVFCSWKNWTRFMITSISLLLLIAFSIKYLVGNDSNVRFRFTKQGAILIEKKKKADKGLFLLSASTLWVNTGVKLKPKQRITIAASGKATFAIHRLVNDAIKDSLPSQPWVGPDGRRKNGSNQKKTQLDNIRHKLLLEPKVNYGTLLAVIIPDGIANPSKINPKPSNMKVIGACQTIENNYTDIGTLWLTVNDGILSKDSKKDFVTNQKVLDLAYGYKDDGSSKITIEILDERWKFIVKEEYWDIWWDDNVGYYLIQFDFNPSNKNNFESISY